MDADIDDDVDVCIEVEVDGVAEIFLDRPEEIAEAKDGSEADG